MVLIGFHGKEDRMMKILSFILLSLVLTSCIAKQIEFDVLDNKSTNSTPSNKGG